jgi:hypothetical protein
VKGSVIVSNKRKAKLPERTINIWNSYDFAMCGLGNKCKLIALFKHTMRCIKWSKQRIVRGYSDSDVWEMFTYLQTIIPDMLQNLKENRHGSPGILGENYTDEKGILVNDTCHAEWDEILEKMIFLWHETKEETCSQKNIYEEEHFKAFDEFTNKYGLLGEKLQTPKELDENSKHGVNTVHFMSELPEYKDIDDKYHQESEKLELYRDNCKNEALDMLKKYFWYLWD